MYSDIFRKPIFFHKILIIYAKKGNKISSMKKRNKRKMFHQHCKLLRSKWCTLYIKFIIAWYRL